MAAVVFLAWIAPSAIAQETAQPGAGASVPQAGATSPETVGDAGAGGVVSEDALRQARRAFEDGFYRLVIERLRAWMEARPDAAESGEAALLLGRAYHAERLYGEGRRALEAAIEHGAGDVAPSALRFWAGECARGENNPVAAERHYREALNAGAEADVADRAWLGVGWARLAQGDGDGAFEAFARAMESSEPAVVSAARIDAGTAVLAGGRAADALSWFDEILADEDLAALHPRAIVWRAHGLAELGRTDEALAEFSRAVESAAGSDPVTVARARVDRGDLLRRMGLAEEAGAEYEAAAALAADPETRARALVGAAQARLGAGGVDEAIGRLEAFLADQPDSGLADDVRMAIGDVYFERKDYEVAGGHYAALVAYHPESPFVPRARFQGAWCELALGNFAEALAGFEKVAATAPDELQARSAFKIGDVLLAMRRFPEAIEAYGRVAAADRGTGLAARALYQIGQTRLRQGEIDQAIEGLREVAVRYPGSPFAPGALLQVGRAEYGLGAMDRAGEAFSAVVEGYPETPESMEATLGLGQTLSAQGRFEEAVEVFGRYLELYPEEPEVPRAMYEQAWAIALGRGGEAAAPAFREFLSRFPGHPLSADIRLRMGEDLYNGGELAAARAVLLELVERRAESELADDALFLAGRCASEEGDHIESVRLFGRIEGEYPESPFAEDARFWQADELTRMGMYDGALMAFQKFLDQHPASRLAPGARGRLGDCQYSLGRYEDAVESYLRLLESPGISPGLRDQAEYKLGQAFEQLGRDGDAFDRYMSVVYRFFDEGYVLAEGVDWLWFCRAGIAAGRLEERGERWTEAVRVYERLARSAAPCSAEANQRIRRIRLERLLDLAPGG